MLPLGTPVLKCLKTTFGIVQVSVGLAAEDALAIKSTDSVKPPVYPSFLMTAVSQLILTLATTPTVMMPLILFFGN